jgi:Zn-dependent peptidase ImmA (M78 family)
MLPLSKLRKWTAGLVHPEGLPGWVKQGYARLSRFEQGLTSVYDRNHFDEAPNGLASSLSHCFMPSRNEIERAATSLREEAGVDEQLPVPLEDIARFLKFESIGFKPTLDNPDTAKVSGMIDYQKGRIFVNTAQPLDRQRFTLAHEIGHAYLHKDNGALPAIVDFRAEMDHPQSEKEKEANQFAAALLMPREPFIRQWLQWKGDVDTLCKIFGASKQAVEIRRDSTVNVLV